jgi:hypothetical protein
MMQVFGRDRKKSNISLPCSFSQQIQYLKSAAEKQTLAVCASSCFMTPGTVEVCQMLQIGMILQCRSRKIFKPYVM